MKCKLKAKELVFLSLCLVMGLFSKRFVSPVTNVLTDFIRIPGGSAATGVSLMFLVIGCARVGRFGAGAIMGFVQGCLALALGMTGYQGAWCAVTYTVPGLTIDLAGAAYRQRDMPYFLLACSAGNIVSALFSNLLIFHLQSVALLLWLLIAAVSGATGGLLGEIIFKRLPQPWMEEQK